MFMGQRLLRWLGVSEFGILKFIPFCKDLIECFSKHKADNGPFLNKNVGKTKWKGTAGKHS